MKENTLKWKFFCTIQDGTYPRPNIHHNCTKGVYPRTEDDPKNRFLTVPHTYSSCLLHFEPLAAEKKPVVPYRCEVPEEKVSWDVEFPEYEPIEFFAVQPVPIPEDPDFRYSYCNLLRQLCDAPTFLMLN